MSISFIQTEHQIPHGIKKLYTNKITRPISLKEPILIVCNLSRKRVINLLKVIIYALGILLLEILTGKRPGKGNEGSDLPALMKVAVLEETTMEVFDDELLRGIRSLTELF